MKGTARRGGAALRASQMACGIRLTVKGGHTNAVVEDVDCRYEFSGNAYGVGTHLSAVVTGAVIVVEAGTGIPQIECKARIGLSAVTFRMSIEQAKAADIITVRR